MNRMRMTLRAARGAVIGLSAALACSAAQGAPVTGWQVDPIIPGLSLLSDAGTNSPVVGDGSADSVDPAAIWASFTPYTLADGEFIRLSGSADYVGIVEGSNDSNFRFGLFKELDLDGTNPTDGWLGFFADPSNGDVEAPDDGSQDPGELQAKNPAGTSFATASWASVNSGRVTTLDTQTDAGNAFFDDGSYDFSLTVSRSGSDLVVSASIIGDGFSNVFGPVVVSDGPLITYEFDRVGIFSGNQIDADLLSLRNVEVTTGIVPEPSAAALALVALAGVGLLRRRNGRG